MYTLHLIISYNIVVEKYLDYKIDSMANNKPRNNRQVRNNNAQDNLNQPQTAAPAAVAGASLLSGAGGFTMTSCASGDESFYCKFVRGFNILKMLLVVIGFVIIAYVLYAAYARNKK